MGSQQLQAGFSAALAGFPGMHPVGHYGAGAGGSYFADPSAGYATLGQAGAGLGASGGSWASCGETARPAISAADCAAPYLNSRITNPFQSQVSNLLQCNCGRN